MTAMSEQLRKLGFKPSFPDHWFPKQESEPKISVFLFATLLHEDKKRWAHLVRQEGDKMVKSRVPKCTVEPFKMGMLRFNDPSAAYTIL